MFPKLLLNACLIFTTVIASRTVNTSIDTGKCTRKIDYSLLMNMQPLHYDITLALHDNTFDGTSSIYIQIMEYVTEIRLHADKLQIELDTILLSKHDSNKQGNRRKGKNPRVFTYCTKTQILVLEFDQLIEPGEYDLSMNFIGSLLGPKGFVAIDRTDNDGKTRKSYVTLFEPTGARSAFPCWDSPTWASTFKISITHSITVRAWSNMPILKKSFDYKRVQTQFEISRYMPVHYLAIAVIDVTIMESNYDSAIQSNINMWCIPDMRNRLQIAETAVPQIDNFIANNMKFTWKGSTINLIVFPNLPIKFLGNWGVAIVSQEYISDKGIFVGHQIEVQRRVAHVILQQYIETFSSFTKWFIEWFRKGLALYLSYDIIAESRLHIRMGDLFVVQVVQPALHNDIALNVPCLENEYDPIYSSLINNKASVIIRMLKHMISKEVFNQDITTFLRLNNSYISDDLWKFLEHGFPMNEYHNNLQNLMANWVSHMNYPIVYLVKHEDYRGRYTNVRQISYVTKANEFITRAIPLTFTTQRELNFSNTSPKLWLKDDVITLYGLDPTEWIIFNIQQTGFYRVNYDTGNWLKLAFYLNNEDHTLIHHLNRAQIIDDAYHFMMTLKLDHYTFRLLIDYLWKEQEYIPWHSMINILNYISPFFNFSESKSFKDYVLKILVKYLANQESYKSNVMTTQLLILYWACKLGDYDSRKKAYNNFIYHFNDLQENKIRAGWEDWTYCTGLITADSNIWMLVATDFINRNQTAKLKNLMCTENITTVKYFLYSIAFDVKDMWTKLKPEHLVALYRGIMKKHARNEEVFDFVLENFKMILSGLLNEYEKLASIIMNVYSECQLFKIWSFVHHDLKSTSIFHEVEFMIKLRREQLTRQKNTFFKPFDVIMDKNMC